MYQEFLEHYRHPNRVTQVIDYEIVDKISSYSKGFKEFAELLSASSFNQGIYRTHAIADIPKWNNIIYEAFPAYSGKVVVFGYDWLGRHFALDQRRVNDGDMEVLLIEPGTGEALEIPVGIKEFHNVELVQYAADALAESFFRTWSESNERELKHTDCVGYKTPLFLSGKDEIENLEVTDMEVYWSLCGQILSKTNHSN